ncbi:MAG TPA: hypothetical protein VII89_08110 [Candidatus Dormibacteraeota bacterium]
MFHQAPRSLRRRSTRKVPPRHRPRRGAAEPRTEPGGVCAGTGGLYIADTNNHRVVVADWAAGAVRALIGD